MKITKKFLKLHYVTLNKNSEKIGSELGVTGRTIRYKLKELGFERHMIKRKSSVNIGRKPSNFGVTKGKPRCGRHYVHRNGVQVPRARYIIEQHYGIKLRRNQYVHHKDENPLNDDISNLVVMDAAEHIRHHDPVGKRWARHAKATLSHEPS